MLVDINLLPDKERERSTLLIVALAILGAAILVWLTLFLFTQNYAKQSVSLEQQLVTLEDIQAEVRNSLQLSEFAADKQALESTLMWAENFQFDTVPLIAGLVRLLPARGFFDSFEFIGPNISTLMVQFDSANEAAYYLTRLQAAEFIADVTFDSVNVLEESTDLVEGEIPILPRYLAIYTISFFDERTVAPVASEEGDDEE